MVPLMETVMAAHGPHGSKTGFSSWQNTFSWLMQCCGRLSRLGVLFAYTSVETKHDIFNASQTQKHATEKNIRNLFVDCRPGDGYSWQHLCKHWGISWKMWLDQNLSHLLALMYLWSWNTSILHALHTPSIFFNHHYEKKTLGDSQVWDTHVLFKDTAKHLWVDKLVWVRHSCQPTVIIDPLIRLCKYRKNVDQWSTEALATINKNVNGKLNNLWLWIVSLLHLTALCHVQTNTRRCAPSFKTDTPWWRTTSISCPPSTPIIWGITSKRWQTWFTITIAWCLQKWKPLRIIRKEMTA